MLPVGDENTANDASRGPTLVSTRHQWLSELWHAREVVYFLALRDVKLRYRQTFLGVAWAVIQPLFTMALFMFVFGTMAKIPTDGIPGPIFYFSALVPWTYFSTAVGQSGTSIVTNANLVTKVYFPRLSLPIAAVVAGLVDFGIASSFMIGMMVYFHVAPTWRLVLWPPLVLLLVLFTSAIGIFLSAVNVRYRDVKHAVPFVLQLWLFATPIIYPLTLIPERFRLVARLNPMTGIIGALRAALVPSATIDWPALGLSSALILAGLMLAVRYFNRAEQAFTDVI